MRVEAAGKDSLDIIPPSYRYDINTQIDIIEEIARMSGYDEIPVTYPVMNLAGPRPNVDREAALRIRSLLTASGFSEVINYSFQDPDVLCALGFHETDVRCDPVQLLNPLSTAQSVMRTTILGSLLQNLQHNLHANRCPLLKIFEISNVFLKTPEGGVDERRMLNGLAYGVNNTDTWAYPGRAVDIFDIKGCIETVLNGMNIRDYRFETGSDEPYLAPQTGIRIFTGGEYCGVCGTIHPNISETFGADAPIQVFELDFRMLLKYHCEHKKYGPFSRYPAVHRDLALIVDAMVTAEQISSAIAGFKNKLLKQWHIFDCYQGKSIESGKKSIAFRMTFQSDERTLTDSEVNKIHDKLLNSLRKQLGVELR
jgi:phenylalanyl-tRNA synthetase beta chain